MYAENTPARTFAPHCHFCFQQGLVSPWPASFVIPSVEDGWACVYAERRCHPCHTWRHMRSGRWGGQLSSPTSAYHSRWTECGYGQRWPQPEWVRPFHQTVKVRGQSCHWEQQRPVAFNEHCTRRRVSFRNQEKPDGYRGTKDRTEPPPLDGFDPQPVPLFQTERTTSHGVWIRTHRLHPQAPERDIGAPRGSVASRDHGEQGESPGNVREQIRRVVTELEEVLGGLKQVQLEMKEVVQQIDVLTSSIDLSDPESHSTHHQLRGACSSSLEEPDASHGDSDTGTSGSSTADLYHTHRRPITIAEPQQTLAYTNIERAGGVSNGYNRTHREKIPNGRHRATFHPPNGHVRMSRQEQTLFS